MTYSGLVILALGLSLIILASIPVVSNRIRDFKAGRLQIGRSDNYRWWVFGTIAIGSFLSVVDHGSVLVALPPPYLH